MEQLLPTWLESVLVLFMMGGVFIGVVALIFSALCDTGKWWVQVLLIAVGAGFYGVAWWWFWLDRGKPIFFHPGYLLVILAAGAVFSGVVSLAWGSFLRSPVTRPGPGQRFRFFGTWLRRFWPLLAILALVIAIWVGCPTGGSRARIRCCAVSAGEIRRPLIFLLFRKDSGTPGR